MTWCNKLTWYNELWVCSSARLPTEASAEVHAWLCCSNTLGAQSAARVPQPAACEVASGWQWQLLWQLPPSWRRGTGPCASLKERDSAADSVLPAPLLLAKSVNYSLSGCFGGCVPLQFRARSAWRWQAHLLQTWGCLSRAAGLCYTPLGSSFPPITSALAPRFAEAMAAALGVTALAGPSWWGTAAMRAVRGTAVALAGAPAMVGGRGEGKSWWEVSLAAGGCLTHFGQGKWEAKGVETSMNVCVRCYPVLQLVSL